MSYFANNRAKRITTLMVLLVWLFALASGMANACLLELPELHSATAMGAAATTSHVHAEPLAHTDAPVGHDDDSDGSRHSCLKACGDGTHTLTKAHSGVDHTDPGPAPWVATLWTGSPQLVSVPRHADDLAIPPVGPPLRVRYSRLAL